MNPLHDLRSLAAELSGVLRLHPDSTITVTDANAFRSQLVDRLVEASGRRPRKTAADIVDDILKAQRGAPSANRGLV